MWGSIVVAVVLGTLWYALWYLPTRFIRSYQKQGIPGHPFVPIVGQLPAILKAVKSDDVFAESRASLRELGPVHTSCFGPMPRLVIMSAEHAEDVLIRNGKSYEKSSAGRTILGPLLGNGLFLAERELWKKQRRLINPAFQHQHLKQMFEFMVDSIDSAVSRWDSSLSSQQALCADTELELDIHKEMSAVTLDVIASAAFGSGFRDSEEVTHSVYTAFTETMENIQQRNLSIVGVLPGINKLPTPGYRRIQKATNHIRNVVRDIVQNRRNGKSTSLCSGPDLLDLLLTSRDELGNPMPEQQIQDEAMTFVIAGHETTANLLTWTLSQLTALPDLYARCVEEVDAVLGTKPAQYQDLKQLTLLDAVLLEALRLFPPVPYIRRQCVEDNEIGSGTLHARVEKGATITINVYMIHRDATIWEDPELFKPERWMQTKKRPRGAFLPFGGGARSCIGQTFAKQEAKVILATLLQRFDIKQVPGQKIVPEMNLTMRPKHGLRVTIRRRAKTADQEWTLT